MFLFSIFYPPKQLSASRKILPNKCFQYFNTLEPKSKEFIRISVRDPALPLIDSAYPTRLYDSLKYVFIPWFQSQKSQTQTSFLDMLREQHKILVTGRKGTHIYQGASRRELNLASGYIVTPSIFRHELFPNTGPFSFSFRSDLFLKKNRDLDFMKLVTLYLENRISGSPAEPTAPDINEMPLPSSAFQLIELPRLGREIRVWNQIYKNYVTHTYFKPNNLPTVLQAMGTVMEEIRELSQSTQTLRSASSSRIVHLLAEYIYLGSHAHPFMGANYSLVMGQANTILSMWNLRGISQSDLDYVAMARPFKFFEQRYRNDVMLSNPEVERFLKQPSKATPSLNSVEPLKDVTVFAHLSGFGDVPFWGNDFIGAKSKTAPIEGFLIPSLTFAPNKLKLFYRAKLAGGEITDWTPTGKFLGTRGKSRSLVGIAFKLEGPDAHKWNIEYETRTLKGTAVQLTRNGKMSGSTGDDSIVGFQLNLGKGRQ